jgi:hypothetical protein
LLYKWYMHILFIYIYIYISGYINDICIYHLYIYVFLKDINQKSLRNT